MKIFMSFLKFQFNILFFLIFFLLVLVSSCSPADNEDEESEYPEGGMLIDNVFYDFSSAELSVYSWNSTYIHHVQIESSGSRYCASDDESLPLHHVEFEWESSSPTMDEGVYEYSDFDAFSVNVSQDSCDEGEMEVTGGTLEYTREGGNAVFRFNVRTDANLDVLGSYKGELIKEIEQ